MENNRVRIKFEATDQFGNSYVQENNVELHSDLGYCFTDEVGRLLNLFLKQMTFQRRNDCIFMEDVTENEMDALYDFLQEYRKGRESEEETE